MSCEEKETKGTTYNKNAKKGVKPRLDLLSTASHGEHSVFVPWNLFIALDTRSPSLHLTQKVQDDSVSLCIYLT